MKLITLNTWGARVREPFRSFIANNKGIDIFCFQEIYDKAEEVMRDFYPETQHNLYTELQSQMPEYFSYFRPALKEVYGLAMFIKKNIEVIDEGEIFVHQKKEGSEMSGHHDRNLECVRIRINNKNCNILNIHGLWNGKGKEDTPERISQSEKIIEFMSKLEGPIILCGDFNLLPNTKSINMIENTGMRNLITEFGVTSTRTILYNKPLKFADYIFVTQEVKVNDFKVLPDVVSDHSPLYLDFDL